ncbi:MAG: efflux RND transporter permease subunit [Acidobacteriota bacterium]|nr:efflux RND transporter permease subunit [Acidobacteriota bacterium]
MSAALARFIWRFRALLCLIIVAGALAFAPSVSRTTIDNDLTSWFSPDDPVYQEYERFKAEFGGTRTLIVAVRAPSRERLFSAEGFAFIDRVSGDIERVETVERVNSLSTATVVDALPATADDDGGIDVRPLIDDVVPKGAAAAGARALGDDLLRGDLISEDGTVTAIVVSFDEARVDDVRAGVIDRIHAIVDPALPAGFEAFYNGSLEISETYNRITVENQTKFTPPILILTLSAVYLMFRSWRKTVLTLAAIGVSVFWTVGLYALMGFSFSVLASMIVPLVIVLAIADDVHMMQHFDQAMREGATPEQAFKSTITHMAPPLLGASATTALGMLSLATSDVVAVRAFGVGAAVGVMVDFVISLVFVPTLLVWMKAERTTPPQERWFLEPLRRVAAFSTGHARAIMITAGVLAAIAVAGVTRLQVDTNHIAFFSKTHPLGTSAAVIDQKLGGVYGFQIMLEGPPGSMQQPDTLKRMDTLATRIEAFPEVRKVTTLADYVKRINKELAGGDAAAAVVPDDPDKVAQELFVFTLGDEGRHELQRMVSSDASASQVSIKLQAMSSDRLFDYVSDVERFAAESFAGTGVRATVTGSGKLFAQLDHYLVVSQVSSFATAFVTVFAVIFLVFRSARYGLLAVVPNLFPVLAVFGVMGWIGISLNIATVMVASVALGVVDDDTIHFISRFKREREQGATIPGAIEAATIYEGRAALTTAIINSAGFAVLMMSEYRPSAWFGGLLALTMIVAFLAEVFILPATIVLLSRLFGNTRGPGLKRAAITAACLLAASASATAQTITGSVSALVDHLPNVPATPAVTELRLRAVVDAQAEPEPWLRLRLAGRADGLAADRNGRTGDARAEALEAWVEAGGRYGDIRAGVGRLAWGRLDEVQPTDVVNPIDVSRFLLDGRSEARLPIVFVRGRMLAGEAFALEAIVAPVFRPGTFDRLDVRSSPFNLFRDLPPPVCPSGVTCPERRFNRISPDAGALQGGARASVTTGRLDWSVSAWRGFVPFPLIAGVEPLDPIALRLVHPRYTMLGADLETVRGKWALRAEAAWFPNRPLQVEGLPFVAEGDSLEAGAGVDRRAGDFTLSATLLLRREDVPVTVATTEPRTNVSLVAGFSRTFSRDRFEWRAFSLANPADRAAFLRGVLSWKPADAVSVESSAGWFIGDGDDAITRFGDRDFLSVRVKYAFAR